MKAAELFVRCLENEGVETIFGIPGEENIDGMDALLDSCVRFAATRHEQDAAFMADVYGRLNGSGRQAARWGLLHREPAVPAESG